MLNDQRHEAGPFDIIGDVHGCFDELAELLAKLGYTARVDGEGAARHVTTTAPGGRRAVFVGDLVDRGPRSPDVLRVVMQMVAKGQAMCVPGNHDVKFRRWMAGRDVKLTHGLSQTVEQMQRQPEQLSSAAGTFIDALATHLWLADGALAVSHAGIKQEYLGTSSGKERHFCLYGDSTGERDEFGLPIRYNWAAEYRGETAIVYGHTPVPAPVWVNNTLCIDTGCVFGGALTALRWPERELIAVKAKRAYATKIRPFGHPPDRPHAAN